MALHHHQAIEAAALEVTMAPGHVVVRVGCTCSPQMSPYSPRSRWPLGDCGHRSLRHGRTCGEDQNIENAANGQMP